MVITEIERIGVRLAVEHPKSMSPFLATLRNYRTVDLRGNEPDVSLSVTTGRPEVRVGARSIAVAIPAVDVTARGFQVAVDQAFAMGLERTGRHVIHASAIAADGAVLGMWGQSGAGKTTLARKIHRRHGAAVISNGALVLSVRGNEVLAHGASKRTAKLRLSSDQPGTEVVGGPAYETKRDVDITEWGAGTVTLPLPVTAFRVVRAVRGLTGAYVAPIDVPRMLPKVYQEMSRSVLGTEALIFDAQGRPLLGFPSLSTRAGHRSRWTLASMLVEMGAHATGPIDDLAAELWRGFQQETVPR